MRARLTVSIEVQMTVLLKKMQYINLASTDYANIESTLISLVMLLFYKYKRAKQSHDVMGTHNHVVQATAMNIDLNDSEAYGKASSTKLRRHNATSWPNYY